MHDQGGRPICWACLWAPPGLTLVPPPFVEVGLHPGVWSAKHPLVDEELLFRGHVQAAYDDWRSNELVFTTWKHSASYKMHLLQWELIKQHRANHVGAGERRWPDVDREIYAQWQEARTDAGTAVSAVLTPRHKSAKKQSTSR
ncbi:hypothetical protein EVG20_g10369 [Dentipellis fragilis]|uniref:Uncharacterized protein n=1 Tax=Dentipellis fragilis TaxID=205917 RepID=A0A4Y9XSX6_9AGAM|nr:hypothetical protein EVG20_g10369 [Dentipellis fragilis]